MASEQSKKRSLLITIFVLVVVACAFIVSWTYQRQYSSDPAPVPKTINSFEECAESGRPILESYPEQCITDDGRSFTRELTDEEKKKLQPPTL